MKTGNNGEPFRKNTLISSAKTPHPFGQHGVPYRPTRRASLARKVCRAGEKAIGRVRTWRWKSKIMSCFFRTFASPFPRQTPGALPAKPERHRQEATPPCRQRHYGCDNFFCRKNTFLGPFVHQPTQFFLTFAHRIK